eukprot:809072-Rhodomonas_salina.1
MIAVDGVRGKLLRPLIRPSHGTWSTSLPVHFPTPHNPETETLNPEPQTNVHIRDVALSLLQSVLLKQLLLVLDVIFARNIFPLCGRAWDVQLSVC